MAGAISPAYNVPHCNLPNSPTKSNPLRNNAMPLTLSHFLPIFRLPEIMSHSSYVWPSARIAVMEHNILASSHPYLLVCSPNNFLPLFDLHSCTRNLSSQLTQYLSVTLISVLSKFLFLYECFAAVYSVSAPQFQFHLCKFQQGAQGSGLLLVPHTVHF